MTVLSAEIKKIAIFRALQLGDVMCSIPAIRALRNAFPEARISFIGLPGMKDLIGRFAAYVDEFVAFPGYPGLPEQPYDAELFSVFLRDVQKEKFDLILQMQGNGSVVNDMIGLFGARYLAGFCRYAEDAGTLMLPYPNYGHEINRHLMLMAHLGIPGTSSADLEFPLFDADFEALENRKLLLEPQRYVCLHPGSRGSWRQWPPLYFALAADLCAEKGYQVVITGTKEELELTGKVAGLMRHIPIISSGKTDLGSVAALISNARGLIANCTGVSHVAAALRVPSVVISMDGEPERWGPLNKELHRTIDWTTGPEISEVLEAVLSMCHAG
jgi:ADP-heptose:LPS heptosyltransferase